MANMAFGLPIVKIEHYSLGPPAYWPRFMAFVTALENVAIYDFYGRVH